MRILLPLTMVLALGACAPDGSTSTQTPTASDTPAADAKMASFKVDGMT